jgi:CheY-like chemotaxis protein
MNILIAEDQYVIQMMLELTIVEWGFSCDIVPNGLEAVRQAKEKPGFYDLCIMDVSMPVMNGLEATRIIREEVGYFPIVGYCSDIFMEDVCLDAGMDRFLHKPCTERELFGLVLELCGKR